MSDLNPTYRQKAWAAGIGGGIFVVAGVLVTIYPGEWPMPLWVSTLLGPLTAMRMGFAEGALVAMVCIAMMVSPILWPRWWATVLAIMAAMFWLFVGYRFGEWLYA